MKTAWKRNICQLDYLSVLVYFMHEVEHKFTRNLQEQEIDCFRRILLSSQHLEKFSSFEMK